MNLYLLVGSTQYLLDSSFTGNGATTAPAAAVAILGATDEPHEITPLAGRRALPNAKHAIETIDWQYGEAELHAEKSAHSEQTNALRVREAC